MNNINWLENDFYKKYKLPIVIENDCDYESYMAKEVHDFLDDLKNAKLSEDDYKELKSFSDTIIRCLSLVYEGKIECAHASMREEIEKIVSAETDLAVTSINKCPTLRGGDFNEPIEVQLYRARTGEPFCSYPRNEMFHVPFTMRGKVATSRFSINGVPCLYLANTSYGCWIEMDKPSENTFAVSPVLVDDSIKALNLTIGISDIEKLQSKIRLSDGKTHNSSTLVTYIKMTILNIASSFVVKENNRIFKSEYVIPQLIMIAAKEAGVDGVIYYSKKVKDDSYAHCTVNIALFAKPTKNSKDEYSYELNEKVYIGDSYNFSTYKILGKFDDHRIYPICINSLSYINEDNRVYDYRMTDFYKFDGYIYSHWDRCKRNHPLDLVVQAT